MIKKNTKFTVGIIGCGKIGNKRALALTSRTKLLACSDINFENAKSLAKKFKAKPFRSWEELIKIKEIELVIICTYHNTLSVIAKNAIKNNKHVLIEKPGAINSKQIKDLIKLAKLYKTKIKIGYNHKFHPSIIKAKELINKNSIGKLMSIRGRYGHGGRSNYNKEWRFSKSLSGGGQLMDQGSHMIDLSMFFLGDMNLEYGKVSNLFWKTKLEDNAFFILKNKKNVNSFIHVSCTEWKNLFSLEIYGKSGKIEINGLGGSYGQESLIFYKMLPEMGPPDIIKWKYPKEDKSWQLEINSFLYDIINNNDCINDLQQSLKVLKIIEKIYKNKNLKN